MLTRGGTKWKERLEDSLRKANISWSDYTARKDAATRTLVSRRLLMPLYVDFATSPGERWRQLFELLANTEEHQTVAVTRSQFFPAIGNSSLPKKGNLLYLGEWDSRQSVREGIEAEQESFTLERVRGMGDIPVGFGFSGTSANSHDKVTTPYNWLKGRKMLASLADQLDIQYATEGKRFAVKFQMGREDRAFENGIRVLAKVPSFGGNDSEHNVMISSLPIYQGQEVPEEAKRRGYDIFVQDDCKRHFFADDKFGRARLPGFDDETRNENELDHHFVLVVDAASELIGRQNPGITIDNPIPKIPSGVEDLVEVAFQRIRLLEPSRNRAAMLWESTSLMQVYTMMAIGYLNSKRLAGAKKA